MECECKFCGKEWVSRVDEPMQCPRCKRYNWKKEIKKVKE